MGFRVGLRVVWFCGRFGCRFVCFFGRYEVCECETAGNAEDDKKVEGVGFVSGAGVVESAEEADNGDGVRGRDLDHNPSHLLFLRQALR